MSDNKGVLLPKALKAQIIEEMRGAKFWEVKAVGEKYGLSKTRLYYRRLAGRKTTSAERSAWRKANPGKHGPSRRIPKVEGVALRPVFRDFTGAEWAAIRNMGHRLNVMEPLERIELCRQAQAGEVAALRALYTRYPRLRMPLGEAKLSPEDRAQLPWLHGNGGDHAAR